MDYQEILKLLHHRPPYLMVSQVDSCDEKEIVAQKKFTGNEPFVAGHFPHAPVVPGAMIQELCTQSAGILLTKYHCPVEDYDSSQTKGHALGVLRKVEFAKYISIVKPNHPLQCKVTLVSSLENLFQFKAQVYQDNVLKAKLGFSLVNISDEAIRGS